MNLVPERFPIQEWWPPGPHVVARARLLDLDDGGSHVAQHLGGVGAGNRTRAVENAHTVEKIQWLLRSLQRQLRNTGHGLGHEAAVEEEGRAASGQPMRCEKVVAS